MSFNFVDNFVVDKVIFNNVKKNFADVMRKEGEKTVTLNGANAYNTLGSSKVLELFSIGGALRNRSEAEIIAKFKEAFEENRESALKTLFYIRDIRGGLGERRTFRVILKWLGDNEPSIIDKNLHLVPVFGRWDDMWCLLNTLSRQRVIDFAAAQFGFNLEVAKKLAARDYKDTELRGWLSLLGKWLPSENASSFETRRYATILRKGFHMTAKQYRQNLSFLRKVLNVVEVKMSNGEWDEINFESVPSCAMAKYASAFSHHTPYAFDVYVKKVKEEKAKVNASTLYPSNILRKVCNFNLFGMSEIYYDENSKAIYEAQWKHLPNYVKGENNFLVMADVSCSMLDGYGSIYTSVGLAMYFAERNKGFYKDLCMAFTDEPSYINFNKGKTLGEKAKLAFERCKYNTNLEKVFMKVLKDAVENNIPTAEMPAAIIVISDMEIDAFPHKYRYDFVNGMEKYFNNYGYKMPKLVLWNVQSRKDTFLTQNKNVLKISGNSPSAFKYLCGALEGKTDYDLMMDVLSNERYKRVYA